MNVTRTPSLPRSASQYRTLFASGMSCSRCVSIQRKLTTRYQTFHLLLAPTDICYHKYVKHWNLQNRTLNIYSQSHAVYILIKIFLPTNYKFVVVYNILNWCFQILFQIIKIEKQWLELKKKSGCLGDSKKQNLFITRGKKRFITLLNCFIVSRQFLPPFKKVPST